MAIQVDTAGEITRQLNLTLTRIDELLAGQPTDWQHWYLPQLRRQVTDILAEFGAAAGAAMRDGAEKSWDKDTVMLPKAALLALPDHLERPKAILWGKHDGALHYVFDVPGESRLGNVVVRPRATDDRVRHRHHNFIVSGGLTGRDDLMNAADYEPIQGAP